MQLLHLIWKDFRLPFLAVLLLSLISAVIGVSVIAFINHYMVDVQALSAASVLPVFLGLIMLLLVVSLAAQLSLTVIGHKFVYHFQSALVKRILDTDVEQLETLGSSKLLASLANDFRLITLAFMRFPELVQGIILCAMAAGYLGWLSTKMLAFMLCWLVFVLLIGGQLVRRVYGHYKAVREEEDRLYKDYESVIAGKKELTLNKARAAKQFARYQAHASNLKQHMIKGDTFHLSALNWSNVMMLASIGIVFFLANGLGWASTSVAMTYTLTLLFIQSPLVQAVGSVPALLNGEVAFKKLASLNLVPYQSDFELNNTASSWQKIKLKGISYTYPQIEHTQSFSIGPIDFELRRGEVVFLIGGNGSGKTTFAKLLTGLYKPTSGGIFVDNQPILADDYGQYQQRYSAVFTDLHLFNQLLGSQGERANKPLLDEWLAKLKLTQKLSIDNDLVNNTELSQGQKKRLALLLAVLEEKSILLLDEWAADQDPQFRRFFYHNLIPELQTMGKTLIIISHDDHYFERADRLLEMKHGQLVELTGVDREKASRDAIAQISA